MILAPAMATADDFLSHPHGLLLRVAHRGPRVMGRLSCWREPVPS